MHMFCYPVMCFRNLKTSYIRITRFKNNSLSLKSEECFFLEVRAEKKEKVLCVSLEKAEMPKKLREKDKSASTALLEAMVMLLFTVVTCMFFL